MLADEAAAGAKAPKNSENCGTHGVKVIKFTQCVCHYSFTPIFCFYCSNSISIFWSADSTLSVQQIIACTIGCGRKLLTNQTHMALLNAVVGRRLEDELSYWVGPVLVKLGRLFLNLTVAIHLCCCAFWRVKVIVLNSCSCAEKI